MQAHPCAPNIICLLQPRLQCTQWSNTKLCWKYCGQTSRDAHAVQIASTSLRRLGVTPILRKIKKESALGMQVGVPQRGCKVGAVLTSVDVFLPCAETLSQLGDEVKAKAGAILGVTSRIGGKPPKPANWELPNLGVLLAIVTRSALLCSVAPFCNLLHSFAIFCILAFAPFVLSCTRLRVPPGALHLSRHTCR